MKSFLHVGCGAQNKNDLMGFNNDSWHEIRFDIDPSASPDIVGTLTDMANVKTGSVDAIYSSHNLEHIYPHEVPIALNEFYRVLNNDGFVVITCPDLQSVCQAVVEDKLLNPLYDSAMGPISPIDIIYGHRGFIASGNEYMAHKGGFTYSVLDYAFFEAGFKVRIGASKPSTWDIWLVASKNEKTEKELQDLNQTFLPFDN